MSSKVVFGALAIIVVGFFAVAIVFKQPAPPRPGTAQVDNKGSHVDDKQYGGSEPPTSGDHATPVTWGTYRVEVSDVRVLHNLEHGGIFISYRPEISTDEIVKLEKLFSVPSSRDTFNPAKAVVAPRDANKANIVLSSWNRSQSFDAFDEAGMYEYYLRNLNKSPEPLGG